MPEVISLGQLAVAVLPTIAVILILAYWQASYKTAILAVLRMLVQLLLVGYILAAIFLAEQAWIVGLTLLVMICVASWISLRTVGKQRRKWIGYSLLSIIVGGGSVLLLIAFGVLDLEPWFAPRYVIPLAGMIFANCMNAVSLAVERYAAECDAEKTPEEARRVALEASLIPTTNSLLAVGLVSIPGMMTGQVLAGVDPPIAARYQILVMCMIYGSAGLTSACFLWLISRGSSSSVLGEQELKVRQ